MTAPVWLTGYPDSIIDSALQLRQQGKLQAYLLQRYPDRHQIQGDKALFAYANQLKQQHLRHAPPLQKAHYDSKLQVLSQALGMHTRQTRQHGSKLRSHNSIRIASLFREAPAALLEMIVVHELAHFREHQHNRAFYQLCQHMLGDYHQRELDARLWLWWRELHPGSVIAD